MDAFSRVRKYFSFRKSVSPLNFEKLSVYRHDHIVLLNVIKKYKANINLVDHEGRTIMAYMVQHNIHTKDLIHTALKKGADVFARMSFKNSDTIFVGIIKSGG